MRNILRSCILTCLLSLCANVAFSQDEESLMTYDLATSAMDAAEAYAREKGWNVTILITDQSNNCLLYTSPSPRDATLSRMPSSA